MSGTLDGGIAIQIAAGSYKQIRSGLLDLIWHPSRFNLPVLVDTPRHPTDKSVRQAGTILAESKVSGGVLRPAGTPHEG